MIKIYHFVLVCLQPRGTARYTKFVEGDLMRTTWKNIKRIGLTVVAAFGLILLLPAQQSNAASLGMMEQIFQRVGLQYPFQMNKPVNDDMISKNYKYYNHYPSENYNISNPTPNQKPVAAKERQSTVATKENQSSSALADRIIATGEKFLGTPYQYGAPAGQTRTFDCSSFVQYVFKVNGIDLPRSSREQATVGKTVSRSELKKGDLVFFTTSHSGGNIGHVGIYAGNNKILHTWGPGGVRFDSMDQSWLKYGFVTAKRVIPE